ncbi:E1 [Wels catfish papillomavirus 1]|nr:E1 [Wels catfish papillomavirus 1]
MWLGYRVIMATYDELFDAEADCSDLEDGDLEESLKQLYQCDCICMKSDCESCKDKLFLNDEPEESDPNFYRTLDVQSIREDINNDVLLSSALLTTPEKVVTEKRTCTPRTIKEREEESDARGKRRALFRASIDSGVLSSHTIENNSVHYDVSVEDTEEITQILDNLEPLDEDTQTKEARDVRAELSAGNTIQFLRTRFFKFCVEKDGKPYHNEGRSWASLFKEMKNQKTMQTNWGIFFKKHADKKFNLAIEAALITDSCRIRSKSDDHHTFYLLEYQLKQRSISGLTQLLHKIVPQLELLIGCPKFKDTAFRDWAKNFTSVLTEDAPEMSGLLLEGDESDGKFNVQELFEWIEAHEPISLEILLCNYREEARQGNANAMLWLQQSSNITVAKKQYELWKATLKGRQMQIPLSSYIEQRIEEYTGGESSKVERLLAKNGISPFDFLNAIRRWIHNHVKKSVVCFVGPGNCGKSMIADAMIEFLNGARLTWHESNQFWKQGAIGKRFVMLDDVTPCCWKDLDARERRALDGGVVCINKKFCEPCEMKMPPMLLTSNYDVRGNSDFEYLCNRITFLTFNTPFKVTPKPEEIVEPKDIAAWTKKYLDSLDL